MDEEVFNLELRTFLKKFGITAQREIEKAVKAALESGRLSGSETLEVRATLSLGPILPELEIDGEIGLSKA